MVQRQSCTVVTDNAAWVAFRDGTRMWLCNDCPGCRRHNSCVFSVSCLLFLLYLWGCAWPQPSLSLDCRFYQLHSPILWWQREPDSFPLLRPQPHRGSLGLHHLPQVCVSPPLLSAELQLQPRSCEDDNTLRSVFTPWQSHTAQRSRRESSTDHHVLQFTSVTQQKPSAVQHHWRQGDFCIWLKKREHLLTGLIFGHHSRYKDPDKEVSVTMEIIYMWLLPYILTSEKMIALTLKLSLTDENCSKVVP